MEQLVAPDPNIPCEPGWCLMYVRQTFGAPAVEPSATAGWNNAKYKHRDMNFPNAWVPLWFSLDTTPLGHVVLRAPDGRIYSTSTYAKTPYIHPNLDHLIAFYARYKMKLTYLGWSEDISNVRVVQPKEEEDMATPEEVASAVLNTQIPWYGYNGVQPKEGRNTTTVALAAGYADAIAGQIIRELAVLKEVVSQLSVKQGVSIDYSAIAKAVLDEEAKRLAE